LITPHIFLHIFLSSLPAKARLHNVSLLALPCKTPFAEQALLVIIIRNMTPIMANTKPLQKPKLARGLQISHLFSLNFHGKNCDPDVKVLEKIIDKPYY